MPRRCTVCDHPDRQAVEQALVAGGSFRDVAGRFDLTKSAVARHHSDHLPAKLVKAEEAAEVAEADDLLAQVEALKADAHRIGTTAEEAGDLRTALAAIRELTRLIDLQGELAGELQRHATVNVHVSAQWVELRTTILHTLAPYPDARAALAAAIGEGAGHAGT